MGTELGMRESAPHPTPGKELEGGPPMKIGISAMRSKSCTLRVPDTVTSLSA